jgi:hypothetical protein
MGEKPIPVKIAPRGASGKPLDYNDILHSRKSKVVTSAFYWKFDLPIFCYLSSAGFARTFL